MGETTDVRGITAEAAGDATTASGDTTPASRIAGLLGPSRSLGKAHQNPWRTQVSLLSEGAAKALPGLGVPRVLQEVMHDREKTYGGNRHNSGTQPTQLTSKGDTPGSGRNSRVLAVVQGDGCWPGLSVLQQRCWAQRQSSWPLRALRYPACPQMIHPERVAVVTWWWLVVLTAAPLC